MQTDSVVIEALLGEADALDSYAMTSQRAEAERDDYNRRLELAIDALEKITEASTRVFHCDQCHSPTSASISGRPTR